MTELLDEKAVEILSTAAPADKIRLTRALAKVWAEGNMATGGAESPPDRPARPGRPLLLSPTEMPRRRYGGEKGRTALLHALAHIEFMAIDLAWDIIARFVFEEWPRAFYDDWVRVALDEALHFEMLENRLHDLGSTYGALPAHDGLWDAARRTAHSPLARLALVPMTFEARGLDTTPTTMTRLSRTGDEKTVSLLQTIYTDEIRHVAAGTRWFKWLCEKQGLEPVATYHRLIGEFYPGGLKAPFNGEARAEAGMEAAFYEGAVEKRPANHSSTALSPP